MLSASVHPKAVFLHKSWILSGPFHQTPLLTTQVQTRDEDIEAFSLTLFLMTVDFKHRVTQMEAVILMYSLISVCGFNLQDFCIWKHILRNGHVVIWLREFWAVIIIIQHFDKYL